MSDHPLDHPPTDHGTDRYDYVEISAPGGIRPLGQWWDSFIAHPCPDCRANVFATFVGDGPDDAWLAGRWHIKIAHDEGCPMMTRYERERR